MVDLPKKKVGIVSCSGEELPEGTVTRQAALRVLEQLRPADTVTICLPLFLAGGEGDRAFARFYPTIAVDGCELRCAARATERYSGKPADSLVVTELAAQNSLGPIQGRRKLNEAGKQAVEIAAEQLAGLVDDLIDRRWNRRSGAFEDPGLQIPPAEPQNEDKPGIATCSCGSGIPVQKISIDGQEVTLAGLPLIFQQFQQSGKAPGEKVGGELLEMLKIYNPVPAGREDAYREAILREYAAYYEAVAEGREV